MSSRQTGLPQQSHNYHSLNEMVTISFFVFHVIYLLLTKKKKKIQYISMVDSTIISAPCLRRPPYGLQTEV